MPQITVIVPVYKVEPYLRRCIDSILNQTFQDFELILVDDGSPDNCGTICDEYAEKDSRIVVIHQTNGGISAARNAGIDWAFANSDSQWLSFVDSDDWLHVKYLEQLLEMALEFRAKVSVCGYLKTDASHVMANWEQRNVEVWNTEQFYLTHRTNATIPWAKLYRKECFQTIRYPNGRIHEDEFITYKILFSSDTVPYISMPLYFYYQNPGSITHSKRTTKQCLDAAAAYEEQMHYFHNREMYASRDIAIRGMLYKYKEAVKYEKVFSKHYVKKILRKKIKYVQKTMSIKMYGNERIYKGCMPVRAYISRSWRHLKKKIRKCLVW